MLFGYGENAGVELRHLRYFATIADFSSFTRAAEQLRVSQPALSRQIRDLEEELGHRLLERVNTGVRLTASGRRFLIGARRLLAASDALLEEMRGDADPARDPLRIANFGTLSSQYFSPFLRRLLRRFPKTSLYVDEEIPAVALRRVRAGSLDAAFSGAPETQSLRGLDARVVWTSPQEILLPANHRLAKCRTVALAELRGERWGVWDERVFPGFARPFVKECMKSGFRPRVAAQLDSLAGTFLHVAEGSFISYGPPIARTLPHPGVAFIPTDPPDVIRIPISLVWRCDSCHREVLRWLAQTMTAAQ